MTLWAVAAKAKSIESALIDISDTHYIERSAHPCAYTGVGGG